MPPLSVARRREELIPALLERGVWQGDFELQRPDGSRIQIEAFTQMQPDGTVLALMNDVTARREAEERIAHLNQELEHRVEQRTRELSEANEQLQGFTYSIAHDLRQHIRGLNINAAMIANDAGDLVSSETRVQLGRMRNSAKQMGQLVDDLLTNARLGSQPVVASDLDVSAIAREAAASVQSRDVCREGTLFEIQDGLTAKGDHSLVALVLENLFDNSCKYSPDGHVPTIRLLFDQQAFCVADDGLGFDMQFAQKIFEPFQRLHRAEAYPGTGIGLANVKRIVERHGGQIWTESAPGKGARFYFTLPGASAAKPEVAESTRSGHG
jgi:signal transduction histidine kinase